MKKNSYLVGVLLLIGGLFAGCSKDSNNNNNGGGNDPNKIFMKGSAFTPGSMQIITSVTVTWVNDDNMVHTVTANDASFDSGDMAPGATFQHTFNDIGTVSYHCVHHAGMTGTIVVLGR